MTNCESQPEKGANQQQSNQALADLWTNLNSLANTSTLQGQSTGLFQPPSPIQRLLKYPPAQPVLAVEPKRPTPVAKKGTAAKKNGANEDLRNEIKACTDENFEKLAFFLSNQLTLFATSLANLESKIDSECCRTRLEVNEIKHMLSSLLQQSEQRATVVERRTAFMVRALHNLNYTAQEEKESKLTLKRKAQDVVEVLEEPNKKQNTSEPKHSWETLA